MDATGRGAVQHRVNQIVFEFQGEAVQRAMGEQFSQAMRDRP